MKPLAFLCALGLCFGLVACTPAPSPDTTATKPTGTRPTAVPQDPTTKTVYVHTSINNSSDTMDALTEYLYDENDCLTEVIQYSGTAQTQRYSVVCDENGNFTQWNTTVGPLALSIHYFYNEKGQSLGSSQYHNGELMASTVYVWTGDLRSEIHSIMPAQNQTSCIRYTYNSQGVRVREDVLLNDVLQRYGIYTTDDQGRVSAVNYYAADGTAHSTISYSYDGLTETQTTCNASGDVQQKTVITYDQHGNLLTKQIYDSADVLLSTETHTWKAIIVPIDSLRASA